MSETVYLLLGSDGYYPVHDNTLAVFRDEADAEDALDDITHARDWDTPDSKWERVVDGYEWLPEWKFDRYTVEAYEVID